jgi:hypothetical protein
METTTSVETTKAAGWASQTPGEQLFSLLVFGLSTAATIAFAYYLITDPSRLNDVWSWTRSLPLLVQGVMWLLLLPWMIALFIWSTPLALVVRIVLVVAVLVFTEYLMFPFK